MPDALTQAVGTAFREAGLPEMQCQPFSGLYVDPYQTALAAMLACRPVEMEEQEQEPRT